MKLPGVLPAVARLRAPPAGSTAPRVPAHRAAVVASPAPAMRSRGPAWLQPLALRWTDCLAPGALVLWAASVSTVDLETMNDLGLLGALPAGFFVALGLLVVSIVMTLRGSRPSPVRFALHVGCLVVVLHGTVPLILSAPNYPWAYKHIGVTDYVSLHGSVHAATDIYQSWPGFFAGTAWLTKLAGVGSPLAYAAWAPVYFNLLNCLMLAFIFGALRIARRTRWLAVFLFAAGNWIGQDYFAPQALAFVLTLAVFGMLLTWFQADRRPHPVLTASRIAHIAAARLGPALPAPVVAPRRRGLRARSRRELAQMWVAAGGRPSEARSKGAALHRWQASGLRETLSAPYDLCHHLARVAAVLAVFAAVVVTHQLSPYMLIIGVVMLTVAGTIRPRWIVVVFTVEAVGYLVPHLGYLQQTQDLFGSLLHPFGNVGLDSTHETTAPLGHRIVSLGAPALVFGFWALAAIGAVRRLRARRSTLVLALLTVAPVLLALLQSYGGEAVLRIYLFSLPWTALLAASALTLPERATSALSSLRTAIVLAGIVVLFMAAFYGSEGLYRVTPGALQASHHFYANASPGSVLVLGAPQFPGASAANYDRFVSRKGMPNLLADKTFLHRELGADDVNAVSSFVAREADGHDAYLALTADQQNYAQVLGLLPDDALRHLGAALAQDPRWSIAYTNSSATIYRYIGVQPDLGALADRVLQPTRTLSP